MRKVSFIPSLMENGVDFRAANIPNHPTPRRGTTPTPLARMGPPPRERPSRRSAGGAKNFLAKIFRRFSRYRISDARPGGHSSGRRGSFSSMAFLPRMAAVEPRHAMVASASSRTSGFVGGMRAVVRRPACRSRSSIIRTSRSDRLPVPDQTTIVAVIVAALRESRPDLLLPAAQLEAETILLRLREAGLHLQRSTATASCYCRMAISNAWPENHARVSQRPGEAGSGLASVGQLRQPGGRSVTVVEATHSVPTAAMLTAVGAARSTVTRRSVPSTSKVIGAPGSRRPLEAVEDGSPCGGVAPGLVGLKRTT
jgi:hypothetical protein